MELQGDIPHRIRGENPMLDRLEDLEYPTLEVMLASFRIELEGVLAWAELEVLNLLSGATSEPGILYAANSLDLVVVSESQVFLRGVAFEIRPGAEQGLAADDATRSVVAKGERRMRIEPYDDLKLDEIIALSLRAWEPVFESIEGAMDPDVYREMHPDWRVTQRDAVTAVCADQETHVWVASDESRVVGFVALKVHGDDRMGEIYMIAVDPDFQRRGIATRLTDHSLDWFKRAGMSIVMVETGGDPGHAPARRTYESSGFRVLPIARYFKKL